MIEKKFYGERLRSARMYRGLTLTELAKRTEISKQSISLYENDNNTPDYMKVRLLASELNFPYDTTTRYKIYRKGTFILTG